MSRSIVDHTVSPCDSNNIRRALVSPWRASLSNDASCSFNSTSLHLTNDAAYHGLGEAHKEMNRGGCDCRVRSFAETRRALEGAVCGHDLFDHPGGPVIHCSLKRAWIDHTNVVRRCTSGDAPPLAPDDHRNPTIGATQRVLAWAPPQAGNATVHQARAVHRS